MRLAVSVAYTYLLDLNEAKQVAIQAIADVSRPEHFRDPTPFVRDRAASYAADRLVRRFFEGSAVPEAMDRLVESLDAADQGNLVPHVLRSLRPVFAKALLLRYVAQLSIDAVAERLEMPSNWVAHLLQEAETSARELLQGLG